MADDDKDLVSQVRVEGGAQAQSDFDKFGAAGEAAFDKISAAAKAAGVSISGTSANMQKFKGSLAGADAPIKAIGDAAPHVDKTRASLGQIEAAAASFSSKLPRLTQSIGNFTQRMVLAGTAVVAGAVAISKAAGNVASSVQGSSDAFKKNADAQIAANNTNLQSQQAAIQLASTQRGLFKQLQRGDITYQEYRKAMLLANEAAKEAARVQADLDYAQRQTEEANERLKKSVEDRSAYVKLVDTFGGPLLTAMTKFGSTINTVEQGFKSAFGPALGSILDKVGEVINKNASAIQTFFDAAGAKIDALIRNNGPAIEKALENIAKGVAAVFNGLIDNAPLIIAFFNDTLIPAIKGFLGFLDSIASGINTVFGTNITGGFLVFLILLGQVTGATKLFFNVLKVGVAGTRALFLAFNALTGLGFAPFLAILIIVIATLYLLWNLDWAALGAKAQFALATIKQAFSDLGAKATETWQWIKDQAQAVLDWFNSFPGNLMTIFSALWQLIKDGWTAAKDFVVQLWNDLLAWFQAFPANLQIIWDAIKSAITNAFETAVNNVKGFFADLLATAKQYIQPIVDMLAQLSSLIGGTGGGFAGGGPVGFAGGGKVNGKGTATSDSIPAWLSNGEYVIKASAVAKIGTSLLNRINSGNFDPRRFATGGLAFIGNAPSVSPGEMSHPEAGRSLQPMDLNIFGESMGQIFAPEDTARKLTTFAISKQNRSAGRKPAWIGRGRNNG